MSTQTRNEPNPNEEPEADENLLGWCLVANVAQEVTRGEGGLDIERGTKHFAPGTLLWIPPVPWDPGHGRWRAVGRHRGNPRRYVNMVVRTEDLENFRVKGVYSPGLVRALNGYGHDPAEPLTLQRPWDKERAQLVADGWNRRLEPVWVDGRRRPRLYVPNPPPAEIAWEGEILHLARYGPQRVHYSTLPPPVEVVPE